MAVRGKVVLLGDANVGKTSILLRGQNDSTDHVEPTINCATVTMNVLTAECEVRLNVWDTAGQELYRSTVPMYVRGAEVGIVVFDLSAPETAAAVRVWISLFEDLPPGQCQVVVVGNKSDKECKLDVEAMAEFCASANYPFFLTSAKSGDGIPALFEAVAGIVHAKGDAIAQPVETTWDAPAELSRQTGASSCNC
jgi:small GTP-binding protein